MGTYCIGVLFSSIYCKNSNFITRKIASVSTASSHRRRIVVADYESLAPPQAAALTLFVAPPLPTAPTSLGCGGVPINSRRGDAKSPDLTVGAFQT